MVQNGAEAWSPNETLRVLIASDIHLGYLENDAIRGEDSFIAFEEVLSLAVQYDVDFILLGGDLFHQAKPTPSCMFKCTQAIRKYCFGDKPINIELLSDQFENFNRNVNYEDPNLNVSYPILSIHGNHDDPVGQGSVSSLDILSITGLVNYFGKWSDYTHVKISPVLIQKGDTKLALYGLSHLKDKRLARLFAEKKVEMQLPEDGNDWFNMFVLHQNRADRGPGNYISESVLPKFLDLVVWGHEHDSQVFDMKDVKRENESFFVIQPGSTVATSLASGEALPKHCVLLQLNRKEYIVKPIKLQTVRPFIFKTVVLSEENLGDEGVNESVKVQNFLKSKVEDAIKEAEKQLSGHPRQPKIPLVRLNVYYERESQDFNRIRFGQNFNSLVADNDVLIMKKEKKIRDRIDRDGDESQEVEIGGVAKDATDVEDLIRTYYQNQPPERRLTVLSVRAVTEAVRDFTLKHDDDIFRRVLDAHRRRCVDFLLESTAETPEEIAERMKACKETLDTADVDGLRSIIEDATTKAIKANSVAATKRQSIVVSSDEETPEPEVSPATGRGRGRGARGGRPRGRGRGRASPPPPSERRAPTRRASPPPPVERRTPRRSAAKAPSWLQSLTNDRSSRSRRVSSDIEISD